MDYACSIIQIIEYRPIISKVVWIWQSKNVYQETKSGITFFSYVGDEGGEEFNYRDELKTFSLFFISTNDTDLVSGDTRESSGLWQTCRTITGSICDLDNFIVKSLRSSYWICEYPLIDDNNMRRISIIIWPKYVCNFWIFISLLLNVGWKSSVITRPKCLWTTIPWLYRMRLRLFLNRPLLKIFLLIFCKIG